MNESSEPAGVAVDRNVGRDIAAELRGACVGHPAATIPWPHRLLHDAAAELDRLRAEVEALRTALCRVQNFPSHHGGRADDESGQAINPCDWRHGWQVAVEALQAAAIPD